MKIIKREKSQNKKCSEKNIAKKKLQLISRVQKK